MKRSIWILNHYALTPDMPGGTRHFELASKLVDMGHDVTIFASAFNHKLRENVHLPKAAAWGTESIEGVRFVWIDTFPYYSNNWRRWMNMVSYMLQVYLVGRKLPYTLSDFPAPDVIIGSSVHLLAVMAAYFLARAFKAHFVMEVRDLWPQTLIDMGALTENGIIARILRGLEHFLYKRAERIIVLMAKADEYIIKTGVDRNKICWIPNGVHIQPLNEDTITGSPGGLFTIMYAGAHGEANGLHSLIQAARIVQDQGLAVRFVLVGDGPEKQKLIALSRQLELSNVEFWNAVPKSTVPATLAQSDALVFILKDIDVLKYGISPNKLFDYLAAAKPVIFSCNAENNIVQQSESGLSVPAEAPELLAEAIAKISQMPAEERRAMGARGRAYVEQHYDTRTLAMRLHALLEGLGGAF
ncbi:MAG: glycosyltransferase family 4 protein [Chloroflexota bacterium]